MKSVNCSNIRVLHVINSMNLGGAEAMIMNIYRKIDRDKIQFDFLVHSFSEGAYEKEIVSLGGRIFRIEKFNGINFSRYYRDCCRLFESHPEFSVVHGHIGSSAALYLKVAKSFGCYTIAHSHSALGIRNLHDLLFHLYSFPTRYVADRLFGCSTKAGIARFGHNMVKSNKYSNFNNGIDISKFSFSLDKRNRIRKEYGLEDSIIIGTVGRFTPQKNPQMIFEIFKYIVQNFENTKCIWVGTGELWTNFSELTSKYGLKEKIILTGPRMDVADILQAFDVFLFPSLWEGLPVSVIEAQASGLPCLLSNTITSEVDITPLVYWKSLNDSTESWGNECIELSKEFSTNARKCPEKEIRDAGYDINYTVEQLSNIYLAKGK